VSRLTGVAMAPVVADSGVYEAVILIWLVVVGGITSTKESVAV
jgi:hypothetical protein